MHMCFVHYYADVDDDGNIDDIETVVVAVLAFSCPSTFLRFLLHFHSAFNQPYKYPFLHSTVVVVPTFAFAYFVFVGVCIFYSD